MADVVIRIRPNGPLLVEGPIKLLDANGNEIELPQGKPAIALCRCGASKNKPFCDGSHKNVNFDEEARQES